MNLAQQNEKAQISCGLEFIGSPVWTPRYARSKLGHNGRNLLFLPASPPLRIPDAAHEWGFPPCSVDGILASSPANGKISKQKRPMLKKHGPFICWLPGQDSNLQPSG